MAGFYADVPGHKMALDRDGTAWIKVSSTAVVTNLTSTEIGRVCNWNADGVDPGGTTGLLAATFPEKRDVAGVFVGAADRSGFWNATVIVETSVDTTNGQDGAWVTLTTYAADADTRTNVGGPEGRTAIRAVTALGVRGIRARGTGGTGGLGSMSVHVYGQASSGQMIDRLALWHPTLDQELTPAYLDWGNVVRGTSETRTFRVKNLSPTKTANTPRVAMDALTDASPSGLAQHAVSSDGTTWLSQVSFANLAPGAITGVVSVRRTTPLTAQLSLNYVRVFARNVRVSDVPRTTLPQSMYAGVSS